MRTDANYFIYYDVFTESCHLGLSRRRIDRHYLLPTETLLSEILRVGRPDH